MRLLPILLLALGSLSCAGSDFDHPLTARAAFDLDCPRERLRYTELDGNVYGVRGCGRKATYVEVCRGSAFNCTWVLNGKSE